MLGSPELYREWGYVALSRGRESNWLYVHRSDADLDPELDQHRGRQRADDPMATLAARLGRSRAHPLISDHTAALAARWRQLHQQLADPAVQRQRELSRQRDELADRLESLSRLVDLDRQRLDRRDHGLRRLRHRHERAELETRLDRNSAVLVETEQHLRRVERQLAVLPRECTTTQAQDELFALTRQLSDIADLRVAAAEHDPPRYLLLSLGVPPDDANSRSLWREAARTVESYRLHWDVTDPARPLGDQPHDPAQQAEHRWAASTLNRNGRELSRQLAADGSRSLEIGLGR